ncbi:putative R3H and G-patch domain protein [Aspergillus stella-maris]|uniref:putative R3H and G-patch domain protein n=1 Tax=Aspergillus stella-maris TaxID=1810926 RepID=UPI003CCDF5B6
MARFSKTKARKASKNPHTVTKPGHFSMQDEARHTEGRNLWRSNAQLRHQAVQFVSAGTLEREKDEGARTVHQNSAREALLEQEAKVTVENVDLQTTNNCSQTLTDLDATAGVDTLPSSAMLPTRSRSLTADSSSEDEIVFRGRRFQPTSAQNDGHDITIHGGLQEADEAESLTCSQLLADPAEELADSASFISVNGNTSRTRPDRSGAIRQELSDEDDILADYIAHIEDDSSNDTSSSDEGTADNELAAEGHPGNPTRFQGIENADFDIPDVLSAEEPEDGSDNVLSGRPQFARKPPDQTMFASAAAFADALEQDPYYGFDIMDFSRSSLRKKKKKHGLVDFGGIDSELEDELISAWDKDRSKKKSKKKEREELRAQGLLGRRKNDPDLKIKYADGIGIEDLKAEIRLFLLSSKNSLSLPPMTKHRRILIHDMAHALRLTSQSRGKGSSRFPVLSKTSRTPKHTQKTISQIDRLFSKERFSPRALKGWDNPGDRSTKKRSDPTNVSYMDGDVVGASAPEIGAGNKGRAMLEKMGWSTGTALGATNNKGILLPVAHVVKNSKAGLG